MTKTLKEIKAKINKDWQNAFPELRKYSQNKYYKIIGSVLVGIELIKIPRVEEYRPHFVIYSLWGNKAGKDIKACLSGPMIIKKFFNQKGFQFSIPYQRHDAEFSDVLEAVKNQLPFSMNGNVSFEKMISTFDEYSKSSQLSSAPNSYLQAVLQEYKLEMAICNDMENQAIEILAQIKNRNWNLDHFIMFNINYQDWLDNIENKLKNRNLIVSQLNINIRDKKFEKLHRSKLS